MTGVIPTALFGREVGHKGLTELIEVDSMHERKLAMFDASDAFVAMPGGLGTLEEVAEVATWAQLGVHRKPIVLLDVRGYFSQLLAFLDGGVAAGFIKEQQRSLIGWTDSVHDVLNVIYAYRVEPVDKWLDADET